jgi:hypothetical protein
MLASELTGLELRPSSRIYALVDCNSFVRRESRAIDCPAGIISPDRTGYSINRTLGGNAMR